MAVPVNSDPESPHIRGLYSSGQSHLRSNTRVRVEVNDELSRQTRVLVRVALRYRAARHGQRSVIFDEFVAVTGYQPTYAIRLLLGLIRPAKPIRRQRALQCDVDVQQGLATAWRAPNGVCGKRLMPFLPELIPALERHGHLSQA